MTVNVGARRWLSDGVRGGLADPLGRQAFRRHDPPRAVPAAWRWTRERRAAIAAGTVVVAAVAVVGALVLHPKLIVYLAVMAALFVPAEALRSVRRHAAFPSGTLTDLTHFVVNKVFSPIAFVGVAAVVGLGVRTVVPPALPSTVRDAPFAVQFALAVVCAELAGYWAHRWMHRYAWLWRFHKIHHSVEEMGWVAGSRQHPADWGFSRACAAVPMLALGLPAGIFGLYGLWSSFNTVLTHSNVRIRLGPLRYVIVTSEYHHWHHAGNPEAYNRNYAAQLPVMDLLFGTMHRPAEVWPDVYGIGEEAPSGWLAQIAWPFRAAAPATASTGPAQPVVAGPPALAAGPAAPVVATVLTTTRPTPCSGRGAPGPGRPPGVGMRSRRYRRRFRRLGAGIRGSTA